MSLGKFSEESKSFMIHFKVGRDQPKQNFSEKFHLLFDGKINWREINETASMGRFTGKKRMRSFRETACPAR